MLKIFEIYCCFFSQWNGSTFRFRTKSRNDPVLVFQDLNQVIKRVFHTYKLRVGFQLFVGRFCPNKKQDNWFSYDTHFTISIYNCHVVLLKILAIIAISSWKKHVARINTCTCLLCQNQAIGNSAGNQGNSSFWKVFVGRFCPNKKQNNRFS